LTVSTFTGFRAAASALLGCLSCESQGAFPTQCREQDWNFNTQGGFHRAKQLIFMTFKKDPTGRNASELARKHNIQGV